MDLSLALCIFVVYLGTNVISSAVKWVGYVDIDHDMKLSVAGKYVSKLVLTTLPS
jgi:hypothetical protein